MDASVSQVVLPGLISVVLGEFLGLHHPWRAAEAEACLDLRVRALTSTLVISQSLTAWLWAPLVTIWKPLAVAVCSSTGDRRDESLGPTAGVHTANTEAQDSPSHHGDTSHPLVAWLTFSGRSRALRGRGSLGLLIDGQQGLILHGKIHRDHGLHGQHLGLNLHELLWEYMHSGDRATPGVAPPPQPVLNGRVRSQVSSGTRNLLQMQKGKASGPKTHSRCNLRSKRGIVVQAHPDNILGHSGHGPGEDDDHSAR